ncbi:MAG TPA: hypothetical protein DCZ11_08285 [Gammaproteobacteria bacterium]|nr:hypothetical protein [Gammaproteobacteria bacterium]MCH78427.1 hypothetical protein [Gammaproteobacteria bacterium]
MDAGHRPWHGRPSPRQRRPVAGNRHRAGYRLHGADGRLGRDRLFRRLSGLETVHQGRPGSRRPVVRPGPPPSTRGGVSVTDLVKALAEASQLLYREAYYLDAQRWDEWLALFTEECEYWMPAWKGEHELTENPKREVSLIYYSTRAGLEDRVWRIRSGQSIASTPVPRTTHTVNNILVEDVTADSMIALSTWTAHCFFHKTNKSEVFYGDYRHTLCRTDAGWQIARKYVVLKNDYVPTMLDIYNV